MRCHLRRGNGRPILVSRLPLAVAGQSQLQAQIFLQRESLSYRIIEIKRVAETENSAPPNALTFFFLTQTKLFMSISTEFLPMARTSPLGPRSSSRKYDKKEFEYVNPESGVTPEFVALIPRGYTPLTCACNGAERKKR